MLTESYTRDGTKLAEHKEKRCNNRNCRVGAFYGFISHSGDRIFMPDALSKDILITSSQTGFMIDYLIEIVSDVHLLQVRNHYWQHRRLVYLI